MRQYKENSAHLKSPEDIIALLLSCGSREVQADIEDISTSLWIVVLLSVSLNARSSTQWNVEKVNISTALSMVLPKTGSLSD